MQSCGFDGVIRFPNDVNLTSCRTRRICGDSPTPPEDFNLVANSNSSAAIYEHQTKMYVCKDGYTLDGIKHELVNDNYVVELPCQSNDPIAADTNTTSDPVTFLSPSEWANNPQEWPICLEKVENCTELPDLGDSVSNIVPPPVAVGQSIKFKCANEGNLIFNILI